MSGGRFSNLKITRGALILGVIQAVLSIGRLMLDLPVRAQVDAWVAATPANVFEHGRVWTLVTSALVEPDFIGLIFTVLILAMFAPTLERFWGMARFLRFVAITSIVAALGGTAVGLALGHWDVGVCGLSPAIFAMIVAFGVIYGRQQVTFSFYIRMTGHQMMVAFVVLLVVTSVLQGAWEKAAGTIAAMLAAAIMTSRRWSPMLAWRRRKIARARAKLTILEGGKSPKRDEQKWLN